MSEPKLTACPFCAGAVQFRKALWPSDGNIDAIIHAEPTKCGLVDFSDGTTDESIIAKWNSQATISCLTAAWDDLEAELAAMHAHLGRAADKHRAESPNDHAGFDAKIAKQKGLGKAIQMVQNRRAALATPAVSDAIARGGDNG